MKKKSSILVIDDDQAVREAISDNLMESGFSVVQAENGRKGIALLKKKPLPCIIITDILMPEKEGLETIIEVRRKYPEIKLIAISGSNKKPALNFLTMASKLGADAVFPKPVDLRRLEKTVLELASQHT